MENITKVIVDGKTWYRAKDVADVLGYKDTSQAIRKNVDEEDKATLSYLLPDKKCNKNLANSKYINMDGFRSLVVRSRMSESSVIANELGIVVHNHKYECKESESIGAIMKAFAGEKMNTQHTVLQYRIDLYFPDYNLAIECDENNHNDRNPAEERRRQRRITKKLKCQWLRFDPDSDDFSIFNVINQIFTIIKTNIN